MPNEYSTISDSNKNINVDWKILGKRQPYNVATKRNNLFLNEKLRITLHKGDNMLNKRTRVLNKCSHGYEYSPACYDTKD